MPKKKHTGLTKAELALISQLLEMASDEFSNHGCNDFKLPATEENKALMSRMIETSFDECDQEEALQDIIDAKDEIFTVDSMLMGYFARRCAQLAKG